MKTNPFRPLALFTGLVLWAGHLATGQAADWQSLLGNSPFGQAAPAATATTGDLEFRGVVQEEDMYLINLFDPATKTSQWLPVKGRAPGLEIQSYNARENKVQITQAGRTLTLPLKQAQVVQMQALPAPGPGGQRNGNDNGDREDRRTQIRDMIRSRLENGGGGDPRNIPPEAQAMIQEFRRRRGDNGNGPQAAGGGPQPNGGADAPQGGGRRDRQR